MDLLFNVERRREFLNLPRPNGTVREEIPENLENPEKSPRSRKITKNKLNPNEMPSTGMEPRSQMLEASAFLLMRNPRSPKKVFNN